MSIKILFLCVASTLVGGFSAFAQREISFEVQGELDVKNMNGDLLTLGIVGGMNQPQFYNLDIDNDGIVDLFVFDRSGHKVLSLISDGKGAYRYHPEFDQIYPIFNDWVVFKDVDQDGLEDIWFKNDALNASISLYKNITKAGDPHAMFEILDLDLRAYNYGDAPLDSSNLYCNISNIPAIEDVDGDGDIDFLTLQQFGSGITLFRNVTADFGLPLNPPVFHEVDVCWGDFQEGTETNDIILARNQWCFRKLKKHAGGSSLLILDGDEDGDRDLIIGNAGFRNLTYLTNGKKDFSKALDTMIAYESKFPANTVQAKVNTFPAAFYQDVNGDGVKDLIVSVNYTDKSSGFFRETGNVMYYENTGKNNKPVFEFRDSTFMVGEMIDHGGHTAPVMWDFDKDGDLDMIIATNGDWGLTGDAHDKLMLYENKGTSGKPAFQFVVDDFLSLKADSIKRLIPAFGDLNRDGSPELLVGQANGSLSLYNIIGSGKTAKASLVSKNSFGIDVGSASAPHLADVDGDGNIDLLVGCYDGNTFYYKNTSSSTVPTFVHQTDTFGGVMANTLVNQLKYDAVKDTFYDTLVYWSFGYSAPFIKDLDGNGDPEFILGTASGIVKIYRDVRENSGTKFTALSEVNYIPSTKSCYNYDFGSNSVVAFGDLDNDSIMDAIVGNTRGGVQYMKGTENCNTVMVGVEKIERRSLKMYPNPANQSVQISGLPSGDFNYGIYSIDGSLVQRGVVADKQSINLSNLSDGIYFVQAKSDKFAYSSKLIKRSN